jgi:hypothetical protein
MALASGFNGRKPEPDRSTVRNRKTPMPGYDIPNVPFAEGRKRMLPTGTHWPTATYNWWRALRVMPHCVLWTDTDWNYATTSAWIHARVWAGDYRLAGELRQRERAMGMTDEARKAMRIRYIDVQPEPVAEVTPLHAVEPTTPPPARRVQAFDPAALGGK